MKGPLVRIIRTKGPFMRFRPSDRGRSAQSWVPHLQRLLTHLEESLAELEE